MTQASWLFRSGWPVLLMVLSAASGRGASGRSAWSVHAWQMDDGLPNNTVTSLAQTPDGYLWVANPTRLARFDGVQFEGFSPRTFGVNSSQGIRVLLPSRQGGLWLAMDHYAIIHVKSGSARVFVDDLPTLTAQSLVEADDGSLWIAYNDGVVYQLKDGKARSFTERDGLPEGPACSLARDNKGRVWFAKSGGDDGQVGIFRDGRFQTLLHFGRPIIRLAAARAGGIWICSGSQLSKYDEGSHRQELGSFLPNYTSTRPRIVLEDSRGVIWIGTSDSGLFRYEDSDFESVPTSHPAISDLLEDHDGNLWVSTIGGGLDRIQPRAVELEGAEKGLPYRAVVSLCEDTNGTLWAATQNGLLVCRKNGVWNQVSTNAGWAGADVDCVAADRAGAIWFGTKDHAVYCLREGRFTAITAADGLASRTIRSLLASSTGDLWMGGSTPTTLQCLRHGKVLTFDVPARTRSIRAMAEDPIGNIWVGASGGVLLKIAHDLVSEVPAAEVAVFPGDVSPIRSLCATPDGSLWIGYAGAGLGRLKNGSFARITAEQGLYDDHVSQIIADDHGWLWFGADHGIFKIKQTELEAAAEGRATRVRSTHYGRDQGLLSLQASFDAMPGGIRSRDDRLWIPMRTALAVINPKALQEDLDPPRIVLRRVTLDERTIAAYGGIMPVQNAASLPLSETALRLPPRHRRLEFEFTALNLSAPENVHFRYRLEGFDDEWVEADTRRSATYPQLPAASYRFRAAACNSDGVWNETEAPLAFIVAPFAWQTWWFRGAATLAFTLAVAAVVRYLSFRRLRFELKTLEQQAALDKERARIARDLHDDLGGSLTQVSLLLDKAQRDLPVTSSTGNGVAQCSTLVRQVAGSVDEIIWAINPRNDTLRYLIDYISQFVVEFLHAASIRCRVDLPDQIPDQTVSPEARHNLLLVVKETLNNIARHSRAVEARFRVTADGTQLTITIEDNGRGFDASAKKTSADGLRNMRQRMEEIGGQCRVESRPDAGSRVLFFYPYPHD